MTPRVLVVPGWPGGFCPLHALEGLGCNRSCIQVRVALAQIAEDLEGYWQSVAFRRRSERYM